MAMLACALLLFAQEIHVSPSGSDDAAGTREAPFATLERARDEIRARGGGTVVLQAGVHRRKTSFRLEARDSGRAGAAVVYRAGEGGEVRISGAAELRLEGAPFSDDPRLDPAARGKALRIPLGGIDPGRPKARGFGFPSSPSGLELWFADRPMTPARWPNAGWGRIASVPDGPKGARFTCADPRAARWAGATDAWVHGYWTWDWADSYAALASVDPATGTLVTAAPHGVYGYQPGKRFRILNVLSELDEPGEWHLDRARGEITFWPPEAPPGARLEVSLVEEPLIVLEGASHVQIQGLVIEGGRGPGISVKGGEGVRISGCTIRNLGTHGVTVNGGRGHSVSGCDLHGLGETGIALEGGNRKTLEPGGHQALNNDLHDYARTCRTYRPGILLAGVGHRVANNRIHDAPHNAVLFSGNDHLLELNEVYRVCRETGDAGAFYIGRDWTMRGHRIRHNLFRDLEGVKGEKGFTEVMGVYLDDAASGVRVEGNAFVRVSRAVMVGGGRDNSVEGNLFVDCPVGVHVDARGTSWAKRHIALEGGDWGMKAKLEAVSWNRPPYSERYPELATLLNQDPYLPRGTSIRGNVASGCAKWLLLLDRLTPEAAGVTGNFTEGDPGFEGPGDYRLRPDSPAARAGFAPIPFQAIGLRIDGDRRSVPPR